MPLMLSAICDGSYHTLSLAIFFRWRFSQRHYAAAMLITLMRQYMRFITVTRRVTIGIRLAALR